jgi:hypothetical protein
MTADHIGKNVLVTTADWFYAPNGKSYRAVWGTLKGVKTAEDTLGIRPNGKSTNWYMQIGNMTIAGCQINYVVQTDAVHFGEVEDYQGHEGQYHKGVRPGAIYHAKEDTR